ncbi:MAG: nitroreductase/quinone reductase family protein [Mycobacterium sp.]
MAIGLPQLMTRRWIERPLNAAMATVLSSPLHVIVSSRLLLMLIPGRRTGRIYRVPAGYAQHGDELFIGTGLTQWRRNLQAAPEITVVLRGQSRRARTEVITDEDRVVDLYRHILQAGLVHARYAGIHADSDGAPNRADLRTALANGMALVHLTLL